jgi:hypothetical protein
MRKRPALDWLCERLARPIDKEACLLWPFSVNIRKPYGQVFFEGKNRIATRVAFRIFYGHYPKNFVCHSCDNPRCVNPHHLYDADNATNLRDAAKKGRLGWYNIKIDALGERVRDLAAHGIRKVDIAAWLQISTRHVFHILSGRSRVGVLT